MRPYTHHRQEGLLIGGHISVSMVGFALDAIVLTASLGSGLHAAVARLISLFWAMQATFVLNGLFVFRELSPKSLPGQWVRYMASNGIGNLANYLIFVGLVASRWPLVSNHYAALCVAAFTAWTINYSGARLWVFVKVSPGDRGEKLPILARLRAQVLRRRLDLGAEMRGGMPGPARIVEQPAGERHEVGVAGH